MNKPMNTDSNKTNEIERLPLWKNVLEEMRRDGVAYGKTYPAEWFETRLKCNRDSMEFGLSISEIRRALEFDGFFISGRGQKGNQYVILPPESNANILAARSRSAMDELKRGFILGTNTNVSLLDREQRRRHDSELEKVATRLALLKHSGRAARELAKNSKPVARAIGLIDSEPANP